MSELFDKHRATLDAALEAVASRGAWTPYIESPSRKRHPEGAHAAGKARFEELLGKPFPLHGDKRVGEEISPYTHEPLGIDYPGVDDFDELFKRLNLGAEVWASATVEERVGVCLEILDRLSQDTFANAYATMHTAGQPFMTAFAGSGANSLDRGLEALTYAYKAMKDVPTETTFERRFGGDVVKLRKSYRLRPRGPALVITCASYPAWNAYPAIFANLATGNPVIVKPHEGGTLPMAMAVEIGRGVLVERGFDPNLLTLVADTSECRVTTQLATDERTAIIDFTGSAGFGAWLEQNCRHAHVYTETAGCNAVLIESTHNLDGMLRAIAGGLCLFSAQMCTAPQNIFVPHDGIATDRGHLSFDEVCGQLAGAVDELLSDPARAAGFLGALQSDRVLRTIDEARSTGEVVRESEPYEHPDHDAPRTATPLIVKLDESHEPAKREWFGPISFVIPARDRDHALEMATTDARNCGAIASYLYTTDAEYLAEVEDAFATAGASIGCNLIGHSPINFTAAYSDYHVTGLNPAGNACLTDLAFVANRFRIVQSKVEL